MKGKTIFLIISVLLIKNGTVILSEASNEMVINNDTFEGFTLFSPEFSTYTYLINNDGEIVHSWESNYIQGLPSYLLENGNLIRGCSRIDDARFVAGGVTGRVEMFDWDGDLIWEFDYSTNLHCLHHDIEVLPNGNVLMAAWEYKTAIEAIAAGRNPNNIQGGQLWPDTIIEVEPTGSSGGNIIWEWHVWDHLIQDYDASKENYGVVAEHPELIDINTGGRQADMNHINSIDYNEKLDQILLSSHHQNEIWIIDHTTTTEEAAGRTGGKYGKGGDLLYRWGNPQIYEAGGNLDKQLFGQHDAQWIDEGYLGEGNILIFNNGQGRPDGQYSSVVEITPPVNFTGFYDYIEGQSYMPKIPTWEYTSENPNDFYSPKISGAQRLSNGNTIICHGDDGYIFEVTYDKEIVWEYTNPYPTIIKNNVFKVNKYGTDYPGLISLFQSPDTPSRPEGPSSGEPGIEYTYSTSSSDPDEDPLYYLFDWGDGTDTGWLGPYNSSEVVYATHIWDSKGSFNIKVKAMDIHGLESEWSESFSLNLPRNKLAYPPIIQLIQWLGDSFSLFINFT
jgi:hypothetical protein